MAIDGKHPGDERGTDVSAAAGGSASEVVAMLGVHSDLVCDAVDGLDLDALDGPSLLPGWSRLTVACHLRYGGQATRQMTTATLAGRASAFYPAGRDLQRPYTLMPGRGEPPLHVKASLRDEVEHLHELYRQLDPMHWSAPVVTQAGDDDDLVAGPLTLGDLALLRLTEVVVHGRDLDVGMDVWPVGFGRAVLSQRVDRLARWSPVGEPLEVVLHPDDAPAWRLHVDGSGVVTERGPVDPSAAGGDLVVGGTANDIVAVLLGRAPLASATLSGGAADRFGPHDRVPGP